MAEEESIFKNFVNLILTFGFMIGLSFGSFTLCTWYGCNSWSSFMRADHLKNYQISLYGSTFILVSYKITSLVNRAGSPTNKYIFEDYSLGRNSPKRLKLK